MSGVMNVLGGRKLQCMPLDRTSLRKFVVLAMPDRVPDWKTLWKCRSMPVSLSAECPHQGRFGSGGTGRTGSTIAAAGTFIDWPRG